MSRLFVGTRKGIRSGIRNYATLQYISDIHLETRKRFPEIPVASKNLALIGDIGNPFKRNYNDFLKYASDNYERIFLISGNHEYWHHKKTAKSVDNRIQHLANKFKNVEYLNNNYTELEDHIILGSTLWAAKGYSIKHAMCVEFLEESLEYFKNRKLIVLTHYMPSFKLITGEYNQKKWKKFHDRYATNLEYLIKDPVKYWLCGHTHCVLEMDINRVPCKINAFGHESMSKSKKEEDISKIITLT